MPTIWPRMMSWSPQCAWMGRFNTFSRYIVVQVRPASEIGAEAIGTAPAHSPGENRAVAHVWYPPRL